MYPAYEARCAVTTLRHHQSLLVVLAERPDAYRFWAKLPLVTAPNEPDSLVPEQQAHYRLVLADDALRAPLPSSLAGLTTTSVILWDRYDAERLSEAQRQALVDWLHWGGRLIVSGPESLDSLRTSFLAPYLPAEADGTLELDEELLNPLDAWTISGVHAQRPTPWRGVRLQKVDGARMVLGGEAGAAPLVVERRAGRGQVVVTAFRLSEPSLVDWTSYDAFAHGCLLARPPRIWRQDVQQRDAAVVTWSDRSNWFEPQRTSDLRFAARGVTYMAPSSTSALPQYGQGFEVPPIVGPGTCAWRDDDGLTMAVREALAADAGLEIPSVRFVIGMIAAYVVLLVPVNWFVFSRFGRPEWAWFAAPVISVGFSLFVIRSANLDVGFARTLSEVVVVEMQPDYARGQVTRWGSLYNSLSDAYDIVSDDSALLALPVGEPREAPSDVNSGKVFTREDGVDTADVRRSALGGWTVASNTTGLYRTEQLADCGGPGAREAPRRRPLPDRKRHPLALHDLRLTGNVTASLLELGPGETTIVDVAPAEKKSSDNEDVSRQRLRHAAVAAATDAARLTAWIDDDGLPNVIEPEPSQSRRMTLLLVHVRYSDVKREPDRNLSTNPSPP
ncbi:MAG: hypothetical protein QM775_23720 [Pirellulales bacterium]